METDKRIEALESKLDSLRSDLYRIENELSHLKRRHHEDTTTGTQNHPVADTPPPHPAARWDFGSANTEFLLGGNLAGKLGFLAIILAAGWFIKLAFDREWLNASARIMTGILIGYTALGGALMLAHRRYRILPAAATGAGIAIIFLSLWGGYYFYDLLNPTETFLYMLLLILWGAVLSHTAASETIYSFSAIGAFLAPILMSGGENSYRFLFTYLIFINVVFFIVSITRPYRFVPYLITLANYLTFTAWAVQNLSDSSVAFPETFLISVFLLFSVRELYLIPKQTGTYKTHSIVLFLINLLLFITESLVLIDHFHPKSRNTNVAFLFLLIAIWLVAIETHRERRPKLPPGIPLHVRSLLIIAWAPLLVAALFLILNHNWSIALLITLSAALLFTGIIQNKLSLRFLSVPFWLISFLYLVFGFSFPPEEFTLLFNERMLLFLMMIGSIVYLYRIAVIRAEDRPLAGVLLVFLTIVSLFSLFCEAHDFIEDAYYRNFSYSMIMALFAAGFFIAGFRRGNRDLRLAGIVLAALIIVKLYAHDIWILSREVRIIALFTLGIALIVLSYSYNRFWKKIGTPEKHDEV